MKKALAIVFLVIIAALVAGVYGIIHDQITFSVSEEYYTKFKFIQFRLENWGLGQNIGTLKNPEIKLWNPRFGVAIVGALATWWVGLIIGLVLGLIGLIHCNGKKLLLVSLKAVGLTLVIAFFTGVLGLFYGKFFLTENPPNWFMPDHLMDRDAFIMVGSMHNFSYLGGLLGLIAGAVYSFRQKGQKLLV